MAENKLSRERAFELRDLGSAAFAQRVTENTNVPKQYQHDLTMAFECGFMDAILALINDGKLNV